MTYQIKNANGSILVNLQDSVIDTATTSISLIGRSVTNYGDSLNDNFVSLLENFASTTPPNSPQPGQLWYNTSMNQLQVYNGFTFVTTGNIIVSQTVPTTLVAGNLWIDTTNDQLNFYDGSNLIVAGPPYKKTDGVTGIFSESITVSTGTYTIGKLYVGTIVLGVFSNTAFTVSSTSIIDPTYTGPLTIQQGFTAATGLIFDVISTKAQSLILPSGAIKPSSDVIYADVPNLFLNTNTFSNTTYFGPLNQGIVIVDTSGNLVISTRVSTNVSISSGSNSVAATPLGVVISGPTQFNSNINANGYAITNLYNNSAPAALDAVNYQTMSNAIVAAGLLPTQSGNAGLYLTTDGSVASWGSVLPTQTGNSGLYLTTNGSTTQWAAVPSVIPAQSGLVTNYTLSTTGTSPVWVNWATPYTGGGLMLTTDGITTSTSISAGVGLSTVGTHGTYTKVTTDIYGRVTAGTTISTTDVGGLGTIATQASNGVNLSGGSINGISIGNTSANTGSFTTLAASGAVSGTGFSSYMASPPAIGSTSANTGSFTTLSVSGTVSGTGFSSYMASPPAIGSASANTGSFTTLSANTGSFTTLAASGAVSGTGFSSYMASPPAIGSASANTGSFTTLSANTGSFTTLAASGAVSGTGFSSYMASPPAIGSASANTGSFTTLSANTGSFTTLTASGATPISHSIIFQSSSSWTVPTGISTIYVTGCGGGGAGAQYNSSTVTHGAGGGGAGSAILAAVLVTAGQTYNITIGAGGVASIGNTGASGASGADTSMWITSPATPIISLHGGGGGGTTLFGSGSGGDGGGGLISGSASGIIPGSSGGPISLGFGGPGLGSGGAGGYGGVSTTYGPASGQPGFLIIQW